jgi:hypothetical protein
MEFKVVEKHGFVFRDNNLVTGTVLRDYMRVFMVKNGNTEV